MQTNEKVEENDDNLKNANFPLTCIPQEKQKKSSS